MLDRIVSAWRPLLANSDQRRWLNDFADRYVNLAFSDAAWAERSRA